MSVELLPSAAHDQKCATGFLIENDRHSALYISYHGSGGVQSCGSPGWLHSKITKGGLLKDRAWAPPPDILI